MIRRISLFRLVPAIVLSSLLVACSGSGSDAASAPATEADATVAAGDWSLVPEASRLSFVSLKNDSIAEVHAFGTLSGNFSTAGDGTLTIALASAQTGIPLRDERMQSMLFDVVKYPQATATLKVDRGEIDALAVGEHAIVQTEVTLDLHGTSAVLPATLRVTRTAPKAWLVVSEQPIVVDAGAFGLLDGIEALREVAGLKAIGGGVPVSLVLSFRQDS
ncbi:YceI family protein [Pseudoxanthomonas kalamensis]|uniref:YceI family protein n=1 Tax=Pseudoxanthomonas kalamensis TaxID=289483 RepID=UPI001391D8E9|nr:YceI family protein [Pseudoxanthomonas kalamensis]